MIWIYRIGLVIDALAIIFLIYELLTSQHSRASFLPVVFIVLCALTGIAVYLVMVKNMPGIASLLLWIPAFPLLLYGLFILIFIILKPDMK